MGYRAGGNSSGSTQGCCNSSLTHDSWFIPCMQERIIGVTPLCWDTSILPMYGTHGMRATSGPSCSAKETPVWSSPASSKHLPGVLTAPSEHSLKVLCSCVGSFSSRHKKKAFFLIPRCCCIGSVLLMQLFCGTGPFLFPSKGFGSPRILPRGSQLLLSS